MEKNTTSRIIKQFLNKFLLLVLTVSAIINIELSTAQAADISGDITVVESTASRESGTGKTVTPNQADGIRITSRFVIKGNHAVGDTFTGSLSNSVDESNSELQLITVVLFL